MKSLPRRRFLALSGIVAVPVTAKNALSKMTGEDHRQQPAYLEDINGNYGNENIRISPKRGQVAIGDEIQLIIKNISEQNLMLGCDIPWALQRKGPDGWVHVAWTPEEYHRLCGTGIASGEEITTTIPTATDRIEHTAREITPGMYRVVILGSSSPPIVTIELYE